MKFKDGDLVQVKTWEEMEAEYGLSTPSSINVLYMYTDSMERLVKKVHNRTLIIKRKSGMKYEVVGPNFEYESEFGRFNWSAQMFKLFEKKLNRKQRENFVRNLNGMHYYEKYPKSLRQKTYEEN